jgi:hypothetical protein
MPFNPPVADLLHRGYCSFCAKLEKRVGTAGDADFRAVGTPDRGGK